MIFQSNKKRKIPMIFISTLRQTAVVSQLHVYMKPSTKSVHLKDDNSGFYACIEFDNDTEKLNFFKYVTSELRNYSIREEHVSITYSPEKFGGKEG